MSGAFDAALDDAFRSCAVPRHAALGPFGLELRLADEANADRWIAAFAVPRRQPADFRISVAILEHPVPSVTALTPADRHLAHLSFDGRYLAMWQPDPHAMIHLFDIQSGRGLLWIESGDAPGWIRSRPIVPLIVAATLSTPWIPLHAAAVGRAGRFVLVTGKGGAGKTTAALSCAAAGWDYAGDDYVLLNIETGEVAPIYSTARLREAGRANFADLVARTRASVTEQNGEVSDELHLSRDAIGSRIAGGKVVAWAVAARRGSAVPVIQPGRPSQAYQAMIVATAAYPFAPDIAARKIFTAIRVAPLYSVDTGTDPTLIPAALEPLLGAGR